jgi:hypothetical protein
MTVSAVRQCVIVPFEQVACDYRRNASEAKFGFSGRDGGCWDYAAALATVLRSRRGYALIIVGPLRRLVAAGIEFIDENGGDPGVRLRKRQRPKKPK